MRHSKKQKLIEQIKNKQKQLSKSSSTEIKSKKLLSPLEKIFPSGPVKKQPKPIVPQDCAHEIKLFEKISQLSSLQEISNLLNNYVRRNEPCLNVYNSVIGDINNDGVLNILDIVGIISYILNNNNFNDDQFAAADFNNDGVIDILDVVGLINLILNNINLYNCNNPIALNYNIGATSDDSCIYSWEIGGMILEHMEDFSYAGYRYDREPIPSTDCTYSITETDDLPNQITSIQNSAFFNDPNQIVTLCLEPGTYVVDEDITIYRDNFILRGSGDSTKLYFKGSIEEPTERYRGIWPRINFQSMQSPWGDAFQKIRIISDENIGEYNSSVDSFGIPRGTHRIKLESTNDLNIGDDIVIGWHTGGEIQGGWDAGTQEELSETQMLMEQIGSITNCVLDSVRSELDPENQFGLIPNVTPTCKGFYDLFIEPYCSDVNQVPGWACDEGNNFKKLILTSMVRNLEEGGSEFPESCYGTFYGTTPGQCPSCDYTDGYGIPTVGGSGTSGEGWPWWANYCAENDFGIDCSSTGNQSWNSFGPCNPTGENYNFYECDWRCHIVPNNPSSADGGMSCENLDLTCDAQLAWLLIGAAVEWNCEALLPADAQQKFCGLTLNDICPQTCTDTGDDNALFQTPLYTCNYDNAIISEDVSSVFNDISSGLTAAGLENYVSTNSGNGNSCNPTAVDENGNPINPCPDIYVNWSFVSDEFFEDVDVILQQNGVCQSNVFISDFNMQGYWDQQLREDQHIFHRTIVEKDEDFIYIDVPIRLDISQDWLPFVKKINNKYMENSGIENLSVSNVNPFYRHAWHVVGESQAEFNPDTGEVVDAIYASNGNEIINAKFLKNCWFKGLSTFVPDESLLKSVYNTNFVNPNGDTADSYEFSEAVKNGTASLILNPLLSDNLTLDEEYDEYHTIFDELVNALETDNLHNVESEKRELMSIFLRIHDSKNLTIENCHVRLPQNRAGGSNGYGFLTQSTSELLFRNCTGYRMRHTFIQSLYVNGTVYDNTHDKAGWVFFDASDDYWSRYQNLEIPILLGVPGPSDTHQPISMGTLVQNSLIDGEWSLRNRGNVSGGAGVTSTNAVFWNNSKTDIEIQNDVIISQNQGGQGGYCSELTQETQECDIWGRSLYVRYGHHDHGWSGAYPADNFFRCCHRQGDGNSGPDCHFLNDPVPGVSKYCEWSYVKDGQYNSNSPNWNNTWYHLDYEGEYYDCNQIYLPGDASTNDECDVNPIDNPNGVWVVYGTHLCPGTDSWGGASGFGVWTEPQFFTESFNCSNDTFGNDPCPAMQKYCMWSDNQTGPFWPKWPYPHYHFGWQNISNPGPGAIVSFQANKPNDKPGAYLIGNTTNNYTEIYDYSENPEDYILSANEYYADIIGIWNPLLPYKIDVNDPYFAINTIFNIFFTKITEQINDTEVHPGNPMTNMNYYLHTLWNMDNCQSRTWNADIQDYEFQPMPNLYSDPCITSLYFANNSFFGPYRVDIHDLKNLHIEKIGVKYSIVNDETILRFSIKNFKIGFDIEATEVSTTLSGLSAPDVSFDDNELIIPEIIIEVNKTKFEDPSIGQAFCNDYTNKYACNEADNCFWSTVSSLESKCRSNSINISLPYSIIINLDENPEIYWILPGDAGQLIGYFVLQVGQAIFDFEIGDLGDYYDSQLLALDVPGKIEDIIIAIEAALNPILFNTLELDGLDPDTQSAIQAFGVNTYGDGLWATLSFIKTLVDDKISPYFSLWGEETDSNDIVNPEGYSTMQNIEDLLNIQKEIGYSNYWIDKVFNNEQ